MTLKIPTDLKSKFETDDTPPASDFADLIDSLYGITRVATVNVDLNVGTKQNLFTIPDPAYRFVPTLIVLRNVSANAATGVIDFGGNANADDWIDAVTLGVLSGAGLSAAIGNVGVAVAGGAAALTKFYTSSEVFGCKVATTVAATVDCDVFGYLI